MTILERALASSRAYEWSRRAIGARREVERLVSDVIRPTPDMRILDLGCGNGRLVPFLDGAQYVGVDSNASYIDAAKARFGSDTIRFHCDDVSNVEDLGLEPVDAVVCVGLLHHLDDATAAAVLRRARCLLKSSGRLITLDPAFEPTQHSIARVLMALDRGRFVRHTNDYELLVQKSFRITSKVIWEDIFKFPYTHLVLVAEPTQTLAERSTSS